MSITEKGSCWARTRLTRLRRRSWDGTNERKRSPVASVKEEELWWELKTCARFSSSKRGVRVAWAVVEGKRACVCVHVRVWDGPEGSKERKSRGGRIFQGRIFPQLQPSKLQSKPILAAQPAPQKIQLPEAKCTKKLKKFPKNHENITHGGENCCCRYFLYLKRTLFA